MVAWSRRGDGWWKQRFQEGFSRVANGCSSSGLSLWWTFICTRQPLSTKQRRLQPTLAAFSCLYSFIYFCIFSSHPFIQRFTVFSPLCSLNPSPLHSPSLISTERRERPDAVRKHSGAVRKAAASCRVLIGQSRMLGVNGKLLHDGALDAVERSEEHRWRFSAFQLHQVLNQRFDQNNQSIEVLSPPKSMSLALWKIRVLPRWTVWKY